MKTHTRYQGDFKKVEITEGTGNASRFGREAKFLGHYGSRLADLLREDGLRAASVDEGVYVNAVAYPEGVADGHDSIRGIFSKKNLEIEDALMQLQWREDSEGE